MQISIRMVDEDEKDKTMNITLVEPFFTGSHADWAKTYARYSEHDVTILSLSGNYWKWRMHGGAVTLARKFLASRTPSDLLLVTDMLDLTTFLALTRRRTAHLPAVTYFHENQFCYPWSPADRDVLQKRDRHYGFVNYISALASDLVVFNSVYHQTAFFEELPRFLNHFPPPNERGSVSDILAKSRVLHLGVDLSKFDDPALRKPPDQAPEGIPVILWNHRWEYDKNPEAFFQALFALDEQGHDFRVVLLGGHFRQTNSMFATAHEKLGSKIIHSGYVDDFEQYARWLYRADIIPITSIQEFFGASLVEAVYCGCYPLLPMRLTYPELFPYETCSSLFYRDSEEFVEKLSGALLSIDAIRMLNFRQYVEKYSWRIMAPEYDEVLSAVRTNTAFM